jgi:tight adherence protein B
MLGFLLMGGAARKKSILTRIQAIREASVRHDEEAVRLLKADLEEDLPFFRRWVTGFPGMARVGLFLEQAAVKIDPETFVVLSLTIGLATFLILLLVSTLPVFVIPPLAVVAGAIPAVVVTILRTRRFHRFEELFPEAVDQLGRAVRAGHAFTAGFELIGKELPDPVGQEFRITYAQQNLGVPLQVALRNMATRMPLPDVRFFVAAIEIQRESGGNLGEVLDSLAEVVRERFKLLRQIRVFTAEGRMSMYILMALPFVAGFGMFFLNRGYMVPMLEDPRGQVALVVALIMQIIGFLIIRSMIKIKV